MLLDIARIRDGYPCMAVIMMDLSRFKVVNDTYGHQAGDQLLVAARLIRLRQPEHDQPRQ